MSHPGIKRHIIHRTAHRRIRFEPEASLRGPLETVGTGTNDALNNAVGRHKTLPVESTFAPKGVLCTRLTDDARTDSCTSDGRFGSYEGRQGGCWGGSPSSRHRPPEKPDVGEGRLSVCQLSISAWRGVGVSRKGPFAKNNCVGWELPNWRGRTYGQDRCGTAGVPQQVDLFVRWR